MRTPIVTVLPLVLLVGVASPSVADPVAYRISGTITSPPPADETSPALLGLTVGSRFWGTVWWDFNLPPLTEPNGTYWPYTTGAHPEEPSSYFSLLYSITFETFTITSTRFNQQISPHDLAEGDRLGLVGNVPFVSDLSAAISQVFVHFSFTPDAFSGPGVPPTVDPAAFLSGTLILEPYRVFNGVYDQVGRIDTFEIAKVPEASGLTLLGVGLALSLLRRGVRFRLNLSRDRERIGAALVIVFLLGLAASSAADPVAYRFSGTVTSNPDHRETRPSLLALTEGSRFYGMMGWDFDVPPQPEHPNGSLYLAHTPGQFSNTTQYPGYFSLWYTLKFETLSFSVSSRNYALITDGDDFDAFSIGVFNVATSDPTVGVGDAWITFRFAPDAFSGTSVPTSLDPALFLQSSFFAEIYNRPGVNGVKDYGGTIETFERTEVPEPPAWALAGIGLALFTFVKRRRFLARKSA